MIVNHHTHLYWKIDCVYDSYTLDAHFFGLGIHIANIHYISAFSQMIKGFEKTDKIFDSSWEFFF